MVQITHALIRNDETGEFVKKAADTFDKKTDGKKTCHCPDRNCPAVLTHYSSYMQTYYDLETNEPYKLKIPAHFKRAQGSPLHDISCTAVDSYTIYQNYARDLGGLSQQGGAFVYNLNIMTDPRPAPIRPRQTLLQKFDGAVEVRDNKSADQNAKQNGSNDNNASRKVKLSEGLNHVDKLAGLLDRTEFDKEYRHSILLRDGRKRYTLAEIFENDTVRLFRSAHARTKNKEGATPVLAQFKPIVLAAFHNKKQLTLQGQAITMRGVDGHDYSVSVKLHCGSKEIYESLKKDIRAGKRSFLVYSEDTYVDLIEFAHKKKEIQQGRAQDRAVFVHVHIKMPRQVTAWMPYNGQLDLEGAGMEMPIAPKPPREIPPRLIV
jgi:hypothetical protein